MGYLKRKIDSVLASWHADPQRLPLIIKGPRQVGKTRSIRHFAKGAYRNIVEINFIEQPKFRGIAAEGYDVDSILKSISLLDPTVAFPEQSTLLFFDEVQAYPEIATALKFFAEDNRFDVVCSGSMMGVSYRQIESNSVGYKTDYEMRSLDFEEFLWAKGYQEPLIDELLTHMVDSAPFNPSEMSALSAAFLDYCVLGGMPAVVSSYIETGTFSRALAIQGQLVADYREDIQKYAEGLDKTRILNVFDHIPAQLAKENKKFQISSVSKGARWKDYRGCVEWLRTAGMVEPCYCLSFPELPLKGNYLEDKCKLYLADTGMLVSLLDEEASTDLRANKNLGVYKGALYENMAADALVKQRFGLYYYKKDDSTLEEDFFVRTADALVPVEVKARDGRAKSLRTLVGSDHYPDIRFGVKFSGGNIGASDGILTFPHFCLFLLRRFLAEAPLP